MFRRVCSSCPWANHSARRRVSVTPTRNAPDTYQWIIKQCYFLMYALHRDIQHTNCNSLIKFPENLKRHILIGRKICSKLHFRFFTFIRNCVLLGSSYSGASGYTVAGYLRVHSSSYDPCPYCPSLNFHLTVHSKNIQNRTKSKFRRCAST